MLVDKNSQTLPKNQNQVSQTNGQLQSWQGRRLFIICVTTSVGVAVIPAFIYESTLLIYEIWEITLEKIFKSDLGKLELAASKKFSPQVMKKIDELKVIKEINITRLLKRLAICKEEERIVLSTLIEKYEISGDQLAHILKGAHVKVEDDGALYEEWVKRIHSGSRQNRISSHASNATQHGISGPFVKQVLFSRHQEIGKKQHSWLQFESHPASFGYFIRHMAAYGMYKLENKQQGPYGSSHHTDKNPLLISPKFTTKVCAVKKNIPSMLSLRSTISSRFA